MVTVTRQQSSRTFMVYGDGDEHSWCYEFPANSHEPVLAETGAQWGGEVKPEDAERLTKAARAAVIVTARQMGIIS